MDPQGSELEAVRLVSVRGAAELLSVPVRVVYDLVADGSLRAYRLSERRLRLKLADIEAFLAAREGGAA